MTNNTKLDLGKDIAERKEKGEDIFDIAKDLGLGEDYAVGCYRYYLGEKNHFVIDTNRLESVEQEEKVDIEKMTYVELGGYIDGLQQKGMKSRDISETLKIPISKVYRSSTYYRSRKNRKPKFKKKKHKSSQSEPKKEEKEPNPEELIKLLGGCEPPETFEIVSAFSKAQYHKINDFRLLGSTPGEIVKFIVIDWIMHQE